jgi:hypothetical protein
MEKNNRMDYESTIEVLLRQGARAQCTFFYRLINQLGPSACRTIIKYCYERLDKWNAALPDSDPNKQKFIELSREHKTFVKHIELLPPREINEAMIAYKPLQL